MQSQGARQLHFHLGPGSLSFLPIHRPNKFGDRLNNDNHLGERDTEHIFEFKLNLR